MIRTKDCLINLSNLKSQIDNDYFKYRDMFYRCMIVNLGLYNLTKEEIRCTTIIEDSHYHQTFFTMLEGSPSIEHLLRDVESSEYTMLLVDMNLYLDSFIEKNHNHNVMNIYSLSIEDNFHVRISNKQISRGQPVYRRY